MYCDRCNRLVYVEKCPGCGGRHLRVPEAEDFCFLAEPDPLWVQALKDLLAGEGVEYLTRNVYGAGLVRKTGMPERVRFFVRCRDHQRATELNKAFFSGEYIDA